MTDNIQKLSKYLEPDYLDNNPYKEVIVELLNYDPQCFLTSQKRDECGYIAIVLEMFAEKKGINLKRIRGEFYTDQIQLKKLDFFKEDLVSMVNEGLNPNNKDDRLTFVVRHNLEERQKLIPHYWNEDQHGNIIDLSGYWQFIHSGMAKDMNIKRYIKEAPIKKLKL